MPVLAINKTLGTEIVAGEVVLTRGAQRHAYRRHPDDYPKCLPHLAAVIANPRYIGDDHSNSGIEIWGWIPSLGELVLVAVELNRDADGRYQISSFYMVSEKKAQTRRQKGFLKVVVV
ncbi:hypothetical protein JQ574_04595 [Bradyrhizobium sp. AUGA SZCCT0158]|uniref:PBECR3 domain-containing polyvalent protein n=1 Tax=Bradyrhizobium sp. AUGA SZCCT0158 TaxID=2807661 RepID=UPI001BA9F3FE|nr:PBECR2 nuclease fold domain-containing protein [Bradyrhizobium sp. AUGA SZCCT0158]MBR1195304.1 hypothetical protein [Bradyrhizobium sp. AUGA SZCCT0158]